MAVEKSEVIQRESPEIEAYKLGLLESAKALADKGVTLPTQQVAEMSGLQQAAIDQATAGIGGYQPFLEEAGYTMGDAQKVFAPDAVTEFLNPYQQAVQDEIDRTFDIQLRNANLQAAGAPGGPSALEDHAPVLRRLR